MGENRPPELWPSKFLIHPHPFAEKRGFLFSVGFSLDFGRRSAGLVGTPQPRMPQYSFDDRLFVDEADDLHLGPACGAFQQKTKIVYCKSSYYRQEHSETGFDFLGFNFRPRLARSRFGNMMVGFTPAISRKSAKRIRQAIKGWELPRMQAWNLGALSKFLWPRVQGWINYYGKFGKGELRRILYSIWMSTSFDGRSASIKKVV